jgi:hypothetical protein
MLCQLNEKFKTSINEINESEFFDYSHLFILQISFYISCKISLAHLTVLMQCKHFAAEFPKLCHLININNYVMKASPYTNQQKCVTLFEFYIKTKKDLEFIQETQKKYNCFSDFDFLNFNEKFYIEKNINIGETFSFDRVKAKNPTIVKSDIKLGKFSSVGFKTFNLKLNPSSTSYKSEVDLLWDDLFVSDNSTQDWSIVSFNVAHLRENQRIGCDSKVQFIVMCFERQLATKSDIFDSYFEKFYFLTDDITFSKKENEHFFIFSNELDCISAALLYLGRFNQILEFYGTDFGLNLLFTRYNCLKFGKQNKDVYLNVYNLALLSPLDNQRNSSKHFTFPMSVYVDVTGGIKKQLVSNICFDYNFKKRVFCNEQNSDHLFLYLEYSSFNSFVDFCKKFELNRQIVWFAEENGLLQTTITGHLANIEFIYNKEGKLESIAPTQKSYSREITELNGFVKLTILLKEDQTAQLEEIFQKQNSKSCDNIEKNVALAIKFTNLIYSDKQFKVNNQSAITYVGFVFNKFEDIIEIDNIYLEDKLRLYSYEAALVYILSKDVYKCYLKHQNSIEFNCTKYECFILSLARISNFILTKEKYPSLIQTKNTSKFQLLMFFITCEIDGRHTPSLDISTHMHEYETGKYKEFETASKIDELFDGELIINEEELKLNAENKIDSHFLFTKHIKDFTNSI